MGTERNLNTTETVKYISNQIKKAGIVFDDDPESYYKSLQSMQNFRNEELPVLTVQFLALLDDAFNHKQEPRFFISILENLAYRCGGQKFYLEYYNHMVYLHWHKTCPDSEKDKQKEFWTNLFLRTQDRQGKQVYGMFLNGKASIYNYYNAELRGLAAQEKRIEEIIKENTPETSAASFELSTPRKAFKGSYEIKTYILGVFSFIEYTCNCLLPFLSSANNADWKSFLKKCKATNHLIDKWTDLFNKEIVGYTAYVEDETDKRRPAQVNIVNEFMNVIGEHEEGKAVKDEYFKLKSSYRNVIAHGAIGYNFYDAITTNVIGLMSDRTETPVFDSISNIDYHAFLRVRAFLDSFLETMGKLYPMSKLFLESAVDIPTDVREYLSLAKGDEKKAKAYLKVIEIRDFWEMLRFFLMNTGLGKNGNAFREYIRHSLRTFDLEIKDDDPLEPDYVIALLNSMTKERMAVLFPDVAWEQQPDFF